MCSIDRVGVYSAIASAAPVHATQKKHSTAASSIEMALFTCFMVSPFHNLWQLSKCDRHFFELFASELGCSVCWQTGAGEFESAAGQMDGPHPVRSAGISS